MARFETKTRPTGSLSLTFYAGRPIYNLYNNKTIVKPNATTSLSFRFYFVVEKNESILHHSSTIRTYRIIVAP
jgi:hypothetical protein